MSADRDTEVKTSILRNLSSAALECERIAAGYAAAEDAESSADLHVAALRYRQLAARAMGCWDDADALAALTANAAHDAAWDAETASCDAPTVVLEA